MKLPNWLTIKRNPKWNGAVSLHDAIFYVCLERSKGHNQACSLQNFCFRRRWLYVDRVEVIQEVYCILNCMLEVLVRD